MNRVRQWSLRFCVVSACVACGGAQTSTSHAADPLTAIEPEELFRRGEALARAQDYVRAEQYFNAAREQGIDDQRVLPQLMSVCVESSRISAAIGYAEPYLDRHPNDFHLRQLVATLYIGLEDYERAERHLREVLRSEPEQASTHYLLATVALRRNRASDADLHFARYIALEPEGEHAEEARHHLGREPRETVSVVSPPIQIPVRQP